MKISVQAELWNCLSDLLDYFLNERIFYEEGLYEREF